MSTLDSLCDRGGGALICVYVCIMYMNLSVRSRLLFQAIVFVVGGGNYIEYQNLVDYTKVASYYSKSVCFLKTSSYIQLRFY